MENWIAIYQNVLTNVSEKFGFSQDENSVYGQVFVVVSYMILVSLIVLVGAVIKKIFERKISRYLVIAVVALMANLAFIVMPKQMAILPLFIGVIILNIAFYFFIKFEFKFKNKHLIEYPDKSDDLRLTEKNVPTMMKIVACPNCGKKTISYYHVLKAPQTCGNCSRKFKINGSEIKLITYFILAFFIFALGIYLLIKKAYPPLAFAVMAIGYLNYFFYKLRLMRLKEV